jgi:hypothetical protein
VNSPHILRGPQGRKTSTRIFVICDFFSETCPLGGSLKHWYTREGLRFEVKTYPELFGKAPERQYRFIPEVSGSGTRLNGSCAARDGGGSDPVATVTHRASKDGVAPAQSGVFFSSLFSSSCLLYLRFPETYAHHKVKKMVKTKLK